MGCERRKSSTSSLQHGLWPDMDTPPYKFGETLLLKEVVEQAGSLAGASLRVLGRLVSFDPASNTAVIEHDKHQLLINTELLDSFSYRVNSLFQFIGEYDVSVSGDFVKARIARNVDGMDLKLFEKALVLRRRFEAQQGFSPNHHQYG